MQPWRATSEFKEFLDDNFYDLGVIAPYRSAVPGQEGLGLLEGAITFASENEEQVRSLRQLLDFVQNLRISPPGTDLQDQYQVLYPLRAWVTWLPVSCLDVTGRNLQAMVTLAHFYAVTLAVQLHLPAPGPAYYPKMRLKAIEALASEIDSLKAPEEPQGIDDALRLMRFPIEISSYFRGRLLAVQEAHRPADIPTLDHGCTIADSVALAANIDLEASA